jgi:hypothetical protein
MQTLKFIITGQSIAVDPENNADLLVPGSEGYVLAEFSFSKEWNNCAKVAAFYSNLGREFEPQILKDGKLCIIPKAALGLSIFKVKVFGKKDNYTICTNKVTVHQKGGRV